MIRSREEGRPWKNRGPWLWFSVDMEVAPLRSRGMSMGDAAFFDYPFSFLAALKAFFGSIVKLAKEISP